MVDYVHPVARVNCLAPWHARLSRRNRQIDIRKAGAVYGLYGRRQWQHDAAGGAATAPEENQSEAAGSKPRAN